MEQVRQLLNEWVDTGLLPGAALRVIRHRQVVFAADVGVAHRDLQTPVERDSLFDLASLTKIAATLPAMLLLLQQKQISLGSTLTVFFPDCSADKREITIEQLLTHTSGLPADLPKRRTDTIDVPIEIFQAPLAAHPGSQVIYSDLGMILLGMIVERVAGERLDRFVARQIYAPLGMRNTRFLPLSSPPPALKAVATEYDSDRQAYISGEVHDEKAYLMGGVAGHAGLFSTADDLCRYACWWLYGGEPALSDKWRLAARQNRTSSLASAAGAVARGLGWQVNQEGEPLSCGSRFSRDSYGHTGFTGTSLWIDPLQDAAVVFLTNAVHFGREHQLRRLRPYLHDAVMKQLIGQS
ncbi:beta-lactamase family protein [Brevibacillus humidisoli]|uniref:serine hydrolase domain-containing protein n=1 Tax=Brevibacillus humidisoli TaxID=2895522 RepID=UPI001E33C196|nr:serine hydrolase domain-containing protein [Brevibacillus humidisoli]UFJ41437.1 beta-lactamase family protein [Brevibacillus humidisoli]